MHMGGRMVGTLDAADRRSLRFTYEPGYATDAGSTPLSVSMPLRVSPYSHATIHPYLWGLLPDDDRVLERWARGHSTENGPPKMVGGGNYPASSNSQFAGFL